MSWMVCLLVIKKRECEEEKGKDALHSLAKRTMPPQHTSPAIVVGV